MQEFPEDFELISFFEIEPEVLDPDLPWFYNTITFKKIIENETLYCSFSPAYGDLDLTLLHNEQPKIVLTPKLMVINYSKSGLDFLLFIIFEKFYCMTHNP
ncbi:hypothetical protein [Larkinella rosea]|uniref:Uncharacterized protein n=1 Tax=Larkinella rosea TaxID=2025312 RepID=A0A3P1BZR8_9BACT|nr:hypothetical protein [Larkinella rosea]RRB06273.1 hypothetical protein EHT25_00255 [Larkinella rosea]